MKPLANLKSFLAVMLMLIVSATLLIAYFRDDSPAATGHAHGKMPSDDAPSRKKPGGHDHAALADGGKSKSHEMQSTSPQSVNQSQPQVAQLNRESGHAGAGHDKMVQSGSEQPSPVSDQTQERVAKARETEHNDIPESSALPGIPGLSRLYHIGATGFFLNYSDHIALTTKQQAALNVIKQKSLLGKATAQRKIEEAEQELWQLTGADDPDVAGIKLKVEAIEKLRGEQRMAFIGSVREAVKLLTDKQQKILTGSSDRDAHQGQSHK